jgi:hypothetical protein
LPVPPGHRIAPPKQNPGRVCDRHLRMKPPVTEKEARAKAEVTDDKGASDALLQEADTWERMADWEDKSNPPPQNSRLKFRTLPVVRPPHRTVSVPVDASQPAKRARGQKSGMASGKLAGCPIEDSALASTEATFPGWRRKLLLPKPN